MVEKIDTVLKALADNMDNRGSLDVGSQASGEAGSQDSVSSSVAIVPFSTAIVKYTPPPPPTSTEPLTSPGDYFFYRLFFTWEYLTTI